MLLGLVGLNLMCRYPTSWAVHGLLGEDVWVWGLALVLLDVWGVWVDCLTSNRSSNQIWQACTLKGTGL